MSVCVNGFAGSAIVYAGESSDFGAADIQQDNRTAYLERYGEYFDIFHCVADFSDGKTVYSYLAKEKTDIDNIVPEDGFELTNVKELANNELYFIVKPDKLEEYKEQFMEDNEPKPFMVTVIVRDENSGKTAYYSVGSREGAKAKAAELGLSEGEYEIEEKWAGGASSYIIEPKLYGDVRTVQYLDENYKVLHTAGVSGEQFAYNIIENAEYVRFVSKTEDTSEEDFSDRGLGALADNSVTESCVSIRIISVNNIDFLKQYKDSLIENGVSEAEAEAMMRKLNGEINVNGLIVSDPDLEKSRQEFFAEKIDKEIDNICAAIGIERNYVTVTRKDMCHIIRGNLTKMQISNAEKLRYYPIITVGEEIEKYKGKIANQLLLTWIREGRDEYHVNVSVKAPESDMTEKACADYFKELLGVDSPENIGVYKAKYLGCDIEYTDCLSAEATINAKQLEKICATGEVMEVSAIPEGYMQAINPTDPVVPSVPAEKTTGDINNDYIVDVTDLTMLSLALVGDNELTAEQMTTADVDGDGAVTLADLAKLRQYLSKKISKREFENITLVSIVDLTERDMLSVPAAIEKFYEDENFVYEFGGIKSSYVECTFSDGTVMNVKDALAGGMVTISDLDKYGINYRRTTTMIAAVKEVKGDTLF